MLREDVSVGDLEGMISSNFRKRKKKGSKGGRNGGRFAKNPMEKNRLQAHTRETFGRKEKRPPRRGGHDE